MNRRMCVGLAAALALVLLLSAAPGAGAAPITVNTNADTAVDTGTCTLREAITNANNDTAPNVTAGECAAGSGTDTIGFSAAFTGMATMTGLGAPSVITTSGLPDITEDLIIAGRPPTVCLTMLNKPCVGINVSPTDNDEGLKVASGVDLTVTDIAVTNATTGIDASAGTLTADHLWIGVTLNQLVAAGNNVGVRMGSDSTLGDSDSDLNYFAANSVAAVLIVGGDDNTIQGTHFGVQPDGSGTVPAAFPNATNIRIVDDTAGPDPATGNVVGAADPVDEAPPFCDGPCNLISNATGTGLDLQGSGGAEGPATGPTTVVGNFVGLGFNGELLQGNGSSGIVVGDADAVAIGGGTAAERNYFADNGATAVSQTSGGSGLTVDNNFLGLNASGDTVKPDTTSEISAAGSGASVADNRIAGNPVLLSGNGAVVENNVISDTGGDAIRAPLELSVNNVFRANTGDGNGAAVNDVFIDIGSDGPGTVGANGGIQPPGISSTSTTQVTGTSSEADGTLVDVYAVTSPADVTEYLGQTTVAGGAWSFTYTSPIASGDCVTASQTVASGTKGTSELTQVPTGGACDTDPPTTTFASGPNGLTNDANPTFAFTASEGGSTFECSLDGSAFASCTSPFTTPTLGQGQHALRVRATDPNGNTGPAASREFEIDTIDPVTIVERIKRHRRKHRAKLIFSSDDQDATFLCRLDDGPFKPCASPKVFRYLSVGLHRLYVQAVDPAGNADPTPVRKKARALPRRRG